MTLEQKIKKIHQFNCELFPENSQLSLEAIKNLIAQAVEELGEIHSAARSFYGRKIDSTKNFTSTVDHISEEVGDCATMILLIGHLFGRSMDDSLDRVIRKLENLKGHLAKQKRLDHIMELDAAFHQPFRWDLDDVINRQGPTSNG